jgi:hypothetical protein
MKPVYITHGGKFGTAAQSHSWGAFGGASSIWQTLTEDQWSAWDAAAKQEKRRRHWPASRRLTGQNLCTELNSHQAFLDLPPLLFPPDHPAFGADRPGPLTTGDDWEKFALKLTVPKVPPGQMLVFGSPPCPAGRRVCRDFRFLGLLPVPKKGVSDITELYLKKFAPPPPGWRVFIRTWHQIDGWRDSAPTQLTVLMPSHPSQAASRRRRQDIGMAW